MDAVQLITGSLLIAEPFLQDPHFGRSVVLVCHYDEDGAFGLVLNKPGQNPFEDETHPLSGYSFYNGGPVEPGSMFFVHQLADLPESLPLKDGICWQGRFEDLLEAVQAKEFAPENCRLLLGYAGWEKGQLESEIEREDWMVYNGPLSGILRFPPETMWKDILKNMGPYYRMVSNFPTDPSLN